MVRFSHGFCSGTSFGREQCDVTQLKGAWPFPAALKEQGDRAAGLSWCIGQCMRCASCGFISFSEKEGDCSWYRETECNFLALMRQFDHRSPFVTLDLRDAGRLLGRTPLLADASSKQLLRKCGEPNGAWPFPAALETSGSARLSWCIGQCLRSDTCNFISLDEDKSGCRWFTECRSDVSGGLSKHPRRYAALDLRDARLAEPALANHSAWANGEQVIHAANSAKQQQVLQGCNEPRSSSASDTPPRRVRPPPKTFKRARSSGGGEGGLRLGIATMLEPRVSNPCQGVACALLGWCASARRLQAALPPHWSIELIVISSGRTTRDLMMHDRSEVPGSQCPGGWLSRDTEALVEADCPLMRRVQPSQALQAAVTHHLHSLSRHATAKAGVTRSQARQWLSHLGPTLYKWELMRLGVDYDAILFTDIDVDVLPPSMRPRVVAEEWLHMLPKLVRQRRDGDGGDGGAAEVVRCIGTGDHSAPINAGVLLLLPPSSSNLYDDGIAVLNSPFNMSHGWNLTGSPATVFGVRRTLIRADGSVLMHAEKPAVIDNDDWSFVGGNIDQGFFFYMLYARRHLGRWAAGRAKADGHVLHHYWHRPKTWLAVLSYTAPATPAAICDHGHQRRYQYLQRLAPDIDEIESPCASAFRRVRAALVEANISCCDPLISGYAKPYDWAGFLPFRRRVL